LTAGARCGAAERRTALDPHFLTGLIGLFALVALIAIRVPIAHAMLLVGASGIAILSGPGILLSQLKTLVYSQFSIYDLSVLPMFVLMGNIAARAGLSRDLFRGANAWLGWMRGGVAMSAVAACAGFGAVCGSSLATASTMGQIALPELRRYRYSPQLATGTLAAGGVLGILIPPSVVLVVYAIVVEASIVQMFMAAFIPGLIAVVMFLLTIAIYVRVKPDAGPPGDRVGREEFIAATIGVGPVLLIFGVVIGGIYFGLFNPTPAAAVGVFMVSVVAFARRTMNLAGMRAALLDTAKTAGMIYLILLGAQLLNIFMARGGVPQAAADDPARDPILLAGRCRARFRHEPERLEDLVRHPRADRSRARPDHTAGRHERVRHQFARARRADDADLHRRTAVFLRRAAAGHDPDRVPGTLALAAKAADRLKPRSEAQARITSSLPAYRRSTSVARCSSTARWLI
jgi:tripartite ATP-independent transporter DctM subunit